LHGLSWGNKTTKEMFIVIAFDLDGVLRDLQGYLRTKYGVPLPSVWFFTYKGLGFWEWAEFDNNKMPLLAKPTKYYNTIRKHCKNIEIWTHQYPHWRPLTKLWIKKYLGDCTVRFLTTKQKRARLDRCKDTILIEDCPNFKSYDRIVLIDKPYNRNIKAKRIKKVGQLEKLLLKEGK